jgi:hypothetical protein
MNNRNDESLPVQIEKKKAREEFEKKFFPRAHERKKRDEVMKEPKLFEEELKKRLRKCLIEE